MLKRIAAFLMAFCILVTLFIPVYAVDSDISAIAKKLAKNPSANNFSDSEIVSLFSAILNSDTYGVDPNEIVNWVKANKKIDAETLSIAFHEETHVFTYGEDNCQRLYKNSEVKVKKMKDTNYIFNGETMVVKTVPVYLPTNMTIKDPDDYKIIKKYLTNKKMLSNTYGLNGLLSEYYAHVRELGFLIKYRDFCVNNGIKDTASDRIAKISAACNEWEKAANEYVDFIKVNYDGLVYKELTDSNTLHVLDYIKKEHEKLKILNNVEPDTVVQKTTKIENLHNKQNPTTVWQLIENFFETIYKEFITWTQEFLAI